MWRERFLSAKSSCWRFVSTLVKGDASAIRSDRAPQTRNRPSPEYPPARPSIQRPEQKDTVGPLRLSTAKIRKTRSTPSTSLASPRALRGQRRHPPNVHMRTFPVEIVALFGPWRESAIRQNAAERSRTNRMGHYTSNHASHQRHEQTTQAGHSFERSLACSQRFSNGSV